MNKLSIASDGQFPIYGLNLAGSGDIYTCALLSDTQTTLTIPANARIAVFGFAVGQDYWVSDAAFSIPSSNTFTTTNRAMLNPPPLVVTGVSTLYFRAPNATKVSVAFYS